MAQSTLPEILVLCMDDKYIHALDEAFRKRWPSHAEFLTVKTIHEKLRNVPNENQFDLIVSPANSYGLLDGAFDDAISRTFCLPQHDYRALTIAAQQTLYQKWRGFAPPGTCTLVTMPTELQKTNRWNCKHLALCPTMRLPSDARWDREIVYECVWSLLCEIDRFNGSINDKPGDIKADEKINRILTTPLATGIGKVSAERWATQFVLALKHFTDALARPQRWSSLDWGDMKEAAEVEMTWN
ncbi:hypothetical protein UA08_03748 [Talaromyces atroroseus]|uniref:Macro domain-like protein n=1 Tax=Talaromyces atroroseus TaxID=1441469 RepID=A0A225B3C5_TALAT|nr:hypothetical protein UA08_03748 [Talaromyces atroroseus]OKL61325.1 hypothetical protein UA08_03748 [Talaromyces atroroseus]